VAGPFILSLIQVYISPARILLVIVLIHPRLIKRWAATKKPSTRPDQSWIVLINASGRTRSTRPNVRIMRVNLKIPVIKLNRNNIPIPRSRNHLTTCMFMTITPFLIYSGFVVKGDGTCGSGLVSPDDRIHAVIRLTFRLLPEFLIKERYPGFLRTEMY